MTIIVGYLPAKGGRASLELAALLARSGRSETVAVTTVVPRHWATPSMAKVDAEFAGWAHEQGEANLRQASAYLTERAPDVKVTLHRVEGRSVSSALLDACEQLGGDLLVVGSSSDGRAGQVVVGSTSEPLLHSSGVPIAIAPRGYRAPKGASVTRLTCAFSGTKESEDLLVATAQMSLRVGGALRIVTFGVRGRTMYPPEVGLHAEDLILEQWKDQVLSDQSEALARLRFHGLLPENTTTAFAAGAGWSEAMDELDWIPGEVLVVGSSPVGAFARVFLGSKAIKIVRYSPVPVVVVPAGIAAARAETAESEAARVATVHAPTDTAPPGTTQAATGSGADPVTA
ncbi:universal stress protein [Nakamurella sp. GG22]